MRVKNLISHPKTQQSFGNDFEQAFPPQIIRKLRSFQYLLHRDSERRYKIAYFEVIISFSTYKTIITHHKNKITPIKCKFHVSLRQN